MQYYGIPYQWEQALAGVQVAQANADAARTALKNLQAQRSNPQEAQTQVDAAQAKIRSAEAQWLSAQAALAWLESGRDAGADRCGASASGGGSGRVGSGADAIGARPIITAPATGVIAATSIHTGELAAPSLTALKLADLDHVTLTIFVPGGAIGQFSIGQPLNVRVDAFPDRVFPGAIVSISDQAEFTPRSVRTPDERTKLVYAVKIKLDNADHVLKPGLQAEAEVSAGVEADARGKMMKKHDLIRRNAYCVVREGRYALLVTLLLLRLARRLAA